MQSHVSAHPGDTSTVVVCLQRSLRSAPRRFLGTAMPTPGDLVPGTNSLSCNCICSHFYLIDFFEQIHLLITIFISLYQVSGIFMRSYWSSLPTFKFTLTLFPQPIFNALVYLLKRILVLPATFTFELLGTSSTINFIFMSEVMLTVSIFFPLENISSSFSILS